MAERLLDWVSGLPTVAVYAVLAVLSSVENVFPPVPAEDRNGNPHDFSASPSLAGKRATNVALTGQGAYDAFGSGHLGILASPQTEELTYDFVAHGH